MEPRENRFAIPLTTLVAGAYVPVTDHVEAQDVSTPPPAGAPGVPLGGGGDADGD